MASNHLPPFALCVAFPHSLAGRHPGDYYGPMAAQTTCPVQHVSVEGTSILFDLRVAVDHRVGMERQYGSVALSEDPPLDPVVTFRVLLHGMVPIMVTHPAV
jgi:hypothetical protein